MPVHLLAIAAIAAATALTPAALVLLLPIALGVPHVVNDVRFLVLPLPRRELVITGIACVGLVAARAAGLGAGVEVALVVAWLVAATRSWVALLPAAVILAAPLPFIAAAMFLHNAAAIVCWVVLVRPRRRAAIAVVAGIAVATVLVALLGPAIAAHTGGDSFGGLSLTGVAAALFPGIAPAAGRALVVALGFLQAIHYAVWLSWIPRGVPRPSLRRDLGVAGVALAIAATAAVLGAAVVDARWARATYLGLATFHIYLELVVLAAWLAPGRARP